jgi:SET domain-containing protein
MSVKKTRDTKYELVVGASPIHGRGVFAAEDIPWGRKIIEYRGTIVGDQEAEKRAAQGATAIMELENGLNIDGFDKGNDASLVNHSRRRPNCFLLRDNGKIWLVAGIEGIEAGEELTYDYGTDYYPSRRRTR